MDLHLTDRVYIVTGGSRGLGLATAEVLIEEGAHVVLSGRHEDSLEAAVDGLGERAIGVVADNADPGTPQLLIAKALETWDRLDGALVSVGGPKAGNVTDSKDEDWSAAFNSVFLGAVRLGREIAAALPAGGSIAYVLSSSVKAPVPGLAISNGLRPGLAMVAKSLADEVGPKGVRVNGLLPGRIDTDRLRELDALGGDPQAARAKAVTSIPLGRYGEAAEFGRAAAFLLSPLASYVTGAMLPVDGGLIRSL
ncbi:SDR family oxidoreductase [Nocardioides cavernaquae]|uniref:SDR family oxidoreductase n=1 Tax=Nocardioides cavernaquae TaxID=2321396 RepID=A0A3A5HGZ5_9ACTN|nr:SDR family oxidoreductase [Nocardioides cavernaquae]RJS47160.1 SDR family oxidoreductase [Nocardioides cavernaquae]